MTQEILDAPKSVVKIYNKADRQARAEEDELAQRKAEFERQAQAHFERLASQQAEIEAQKAALAALAAPVAKVVRAIEVPEPAPEVEAVPVKTEALLVERAAEIEITIL